MAAVIDARPSEGITHVAFGDLFLEDVRAYRGRQMAGTGIEPLFPLWGSADASPALARQMLDGGVRAVLTCVDPRQLPASFVGRRSTPRCSPTCRPASIRAASAASSTPSARPGRCSPREIAVEVGERSRATGSASPICCPSRPGRGGERFLTLAS